MALLGRYFLLAVVSSAVLFLAGWVSAAAFAHGVFALAGLPLMFGAIAHFVPVLTRSGAPHREWAALPRVVAAGGAVAFAGVAGRVPRPALAGAAMLVAACALALMAWANGRRSRCLGPPHPGLSWYLAALGLLALGMAAALGMVFDPARYPAWRAAHLHLNLLGWIGLTALGTLAVLLPTAVGNLPGSASDAARRLRVLFWPALAGVLGVAAGAATQSVPVAVTGALLLALVPYSHLQAWSRSCGSRLLAPGAAASLTLATAGFLLLLLAGVAHAFGALPGERLVGAFIFGFLLPLVSGALAQLLPVWTHPGPESGARTAFHAALGRHARGRALVSLAAAALHLAGLALAGGLALAALLHLAFVALSAGRRPKRL